MSWWRERYNGTVRWHIDGLALTPEQVRAALQAMMYCDDPSIRGNPLYENLIEAAGQIYNQHLKARKPDPVPEWADIFCVIPSEVKSWKEINDIWRHLSKRASTDQDQQKRLNVARDEARIWLSLRGIKA